MPIKRNYNNASAQRNSMAMGLRASARSARFRGRSSGASYSRSRRAGAFGGGSYLRAIVTPETKYFDCGINAQVTAAGTDWANTEVPCDNAVNGSGSAAAYTDCSLIPSTTGSGYGQVNGNRYKLKKVRVRGAIDISNLTLQTAVAAPVIARLVLVMDTSPNGLQAQGEDVFQDIGAAGENQFSFQRVSATSGRFRILKDLMIPLDPCATVNNAAATTVSTAYQRKVFSMAWSPKTPYMCNINSSTAFPATSGLVTCNIFLLAYAGSFTGVAALNIQAASRAYYCD